MKEFEQRKKSPFRDTDIISIWSHDGKKKYTPEITTYKALKDQILTEAAPVANYKVYTALLTQAATGIPTAVVLENTTGGTIAFTRLGAGVYRATLTGAVFTEDKTFILSGDGHDGDPEQDYNFSGFRESDSIVGLYTQDSGGSSNDNLLLSTAIEIRIYN